MVNNILFGALVMTFILMLWTFLFFAFDDSILNGYFKKKLQKRFPVEEV